MLDLLQSLNRDEAAKVLAATTHALSPDPEVGGSNKFVRASPESVRKLVAELREHLHLQADDNSPRAQAKMFGLLAKSISERFLGENLADVRRRLGQRGDLAPNDYTIVFPADLAGLFERLGIRKKQVTETLQRPSQVEHLLTERVEAGDAPAVSLYLRRMGTPPARDLHSILVQTIRRQDQQEVVAAFLIFHADIDVSLTASPLEVLQAFVHVYGLPFRVGPLEAERFVLHEVRPLPVKDFNPNTIVRVEAPNNEHYLIFGLFRESGLGVLEVAAAYTVDIGKYAGDLKRHGIRVIWTRDQFSSHFSVVPWT